MFHLLDQAELDFTFETPSAFEDLESGVQIPVVPDKLAEQYRSLVRAHIDGLQERFSANRIDYCGSTPRRRSITRCSRI